MKGSVKGGQTHGAAVDFCPAPLVATLHASLARGKHTLTHNGTNDRGYAPGSVMVRTDTLCNFPHAVPRSTLLPE